MTTHLSDDPATDAGGPLRLARVTVGDEIVIGLVHGDEVDEIDLAWTAALGYLADGEPGKLLAARTSRTVPWTASTLARPFEATAEMYCVGLNYHAHAAEAAELVDTPRELPIIFGKTHRATVRPGATLVLPTRLSDEFDWEVELGVVIGSRSVDVDPADAWRYVAGYCVVNDITARDLQKRHQQWHLGKNVPASSPVGPWVVARDEFPTPPELEVVLRVNGVEKQRASTDLLIHDIPTLISLLSAVTTLEPGDIIATGTPAGVGFVREPAEFLQHGDVVETEVTGVGTLVNQIERRPAETAVT